MTATMPAPLDSLLAALGPEVVSVHPGTLEAHSQDWTHDPGAGLPMVVVKARTALDVQQAVRWAAAAGIPIVPRGTGTGLSGGAQAIDGCLVISLAAMTKIEIDPATRTAIVEPGAINADIKRASAAHGLWYPPDPSSFEMCSIGGNLATNAGGLCCVKYGVTSDYVLGMDVVLADGTLVELGGHRIKDTAGFSLTKLFVGSEGLLGITTRAILRLLPAQPPAATFVASFPDVRSAAEAVVAIGGICRPSMLELMDNYSINAVEDLVRMGLDREAGALLIGQSDAPGPARTLEIEQMQQACDRAGAKECVVTDDPEEGQMFLHARRNAFQALEPRGTLLFEDVGVPIPLLPDLCTGIEAIAARWETEIAVVAHAGDGNTHPLVVHDGSDPDSVRRARGAFDDVMALALSLGGTITGEHGVGRLKKAALPAQLGPDVMALTRRIKDALDPQGILNPGAML